MADKYRIVTNGVSFRIQVWTSYRLLWKAYSEWADLLRESFSNLYDAKKEMEILNRIHEWREIGDETPLNAI